MRQQALLFGRYLLFQIPGMLAAGLALYALEQWTDLTPRLAWILFGLWVVKDLVMFPVTRIAYETPARPHGPEALVGSEGVVQDQLVPGVEGWVRVGPELWRARLPDDALAVPKQGRVRVCGASGVILLVEAAER